MDLEVARSCYRYSRLDSVLIAFESGSELLAYLDAVEEGGQEMPSLVLLDINMPGMDGFEVLRHIRARKRFRKVPIVVMLTDSDDPRDVERAYEHGASGYQVKPMRVQEYVAFFDSLADG